MRHSHRALYYPRPPREHRVHPCMAVGLRDDRGTAACTRHAVGKTTKRELALRARREGAGNGKPSGAILAIHPGGGEARDRGQRDP